MDVEGTFRKRQREGRCVTRVVPLTASDTMDEEIASFVKRRKTLNHLGLGKESPIAVPTIMDKPPSICLLVRTLTGSTMKIGPIYANSTVKDMKSKIQEAEGKTGEGVLTNRHSSFSTTVGF